MPKFRVKITKTTAESAWLEVSAKDDDAAGDKALKMAEEGNVESEEWELYDTEYEVEEVEDAEEEEDEE